LGVSLVKPRTSLANMGGDRLFLKCWYPTEPKERRENSCYYAFRGLKMKTAKAMIIRIAICILLLMSLSAAIASAHETMNELAVMTKSPSYLKRLHASIEILKATDFDTTKAVSIIINGIMEEIKNPPLLTEEDDGLLVRDGYDSMLLQYALDLGILGESILPLLCAYEDTSKGLLRDWIILARGLLRDSLVHDKIVELYYKDTCMEIRVAAVKAIGYYKDQNDLMVLRDALLDTSYFQVGSDQYIQDGRNLCGEKFYEIRHEADRALFNMGYITERDTLGNYKIIIKSDTLQKK
jgi:hypothetical protein